MCPEGRTCLYKISSKVNDHSSEPDDSDQKLESVLLDAEYEVQVSTIADTNDNARVLELRGQSNLMKHGHGTEEGTTEHREEFSQCAVNVIQDKNHGKILATIVPTSNKCPKWGFNPHQHCTYTSTRSGTFYFKQEYILSQRNRGSR